MKKIVKNGWRGGGEQFRLFLNAIQGLSMKDLFMYVLKKEYMDIGPKQSVFRDLFGDKQFTGVLGECS